MDPVDIYHASLESAYKNAHEAQKILNESGTLGLLDEDAVNGVSFHMEMADTWARIASAAKP
jgi:hypothetical protein